MYWIADAPQAVMIAALDTIDRLEAEESLLASRRVAMGSGLFPAETARAISRDWIKAANPMAVGTPAAPDAGRLRAMGIGVRKVKKRSAAETSTPPAAAAGPEATT